MATQEADLVPNLVVFAGSIDDVAFDKCYELGQRDPALAFIFMLQSRTVCF